MPNILKRMIPKPIRRLIQRQYFQVEKVFNIFKIESSCFVTDHFNVLTGKRDTLTPPQRMIFVGAGDFKSIGNEFFNYFTGLGNLKPDEKVLEVGCGIGRMAIPLMKYLCPEGSYHGFDIVPSGIIWCKRKITRRAPNFRFQLIDIYNLGYNPSGKIKAIDFKFPYKEDTFDFVYLTSVFTHMLPQEMEHYFSEICRVLKKGGRVFITYFLLNEESLEKMSTKESEIDFKYEIEGCRIKDPQIPEAAVGFNENDIINLYKKLNLKIQFPIHYGSWCGRSNFLSFQDIILAVKP